MFSSVILSDSGSSNLIDTPVSVFIKIFIKMICIGQNQINIYWKSIFVLKWISLSLCLSTLDSVTLLFLQLVKKLPFYSQIDGPC